MRITKSDFENWKTSLVGKEFFQRLLKEDLDKLAYGNMTHALARDHIGNAIEVGKFQIIQLYYNMTYEYLTGEYDESDRDRTG